MSDPLAQHAAITPSREKCRNWFVAATKPRDEALAEAQLKQQGFDTFLPRFRKIRRHARRATEVLAPVFPGYCFVQADPQQYPWRSINSTRGVRRLVGAMNGEPQAVPPSAMARSVIPVIEPPVMVTLDESWVLMLPRPRLVRAVLALASPERLSAFAR